MEKVNIKEKYNLPDEVRFCKKCVMSNQRPRIVFDDDGVCYACRFAEYKHNEVDWDLREKELVDLLDKHRRSDGRHDVIVPSSGGKDSAIVAHKLKYQYGMNPLTVTWAPHLYTDIGWYNFRALVDKGFDNVMGHPNGEMYKRLTRMATIEVGDPFQPFVYGQVLFPLKVALQNNISLIFSGENGEAEYSGNPEAWDHPGFTPDDYDKWWFSNTPVEYWLEHGLSKQDMALLTSFDFDSVRDLHITRYFWSYFQKWIPQENFYYATENTGFLPNPDGRSEGTYSKYASLDDQLDGFHYYFMLLKFGIGRATSDAAHEIRDGHIDREEAVALVRRYDQEFPGNYFKVFQDYCGFTEEEFWEVCERWRNEDLWEKSGNDWSLKTQVT